MEVGAPNSAVVNMTRAIEAVSPMLNNPRKTITRVEALVSLAAMLSFVQFILGFCKRRWHNSIVSFFLKVCNSLMFPLIVYILGTMQTSPIKNSVYPVWAVSLIIASGATGAIKKPDLPNLENLVSLYIEVARYLFYYIMFTQLLITSTPKFTWPPGHQQHYRPPNASSTCTSYLFGLVVLSKVFEGLGGHMLGTTHCLAVARWMKKKANSDDDHSDCGPKSMNDYNYLVRYPLMIKNRPANLPTDEAQSNDHVTTVNDIWGCFQNSNDGISADHKNRLKDVCLSFALFELLKRRYFGIFSAEASLRKTKYFVSSVLLGDNDYEWAFKIVETELGLCYDFLFTKHRLIYTAGMFLPFWIFLFLLFLSKIILISVIGVYALKNSLVLETPSPIIEVRSAKADYIIALAFICIILMVYLLHAVFYLASDWVKVSLTCTYVKRKNCAPIAFILKKVVGFLFLFKMNISAGCKNKIGQCSIISDLSLPSPLNKMRTPEKEVSPAVKKATANAVKKAINSLISAGSEHRGGKLFPFSKEKSADSELSKEEKVFDGYSQTWKGHSQIEVMLIWHIATDYCDLDLSDEGEDREDREAREVAVKLSRYYGYLIAFVPELLPYDVAEIRELRNTVREEIEALPSHRSSVIKTRFIAPYRRSEMYHIMKELKETGEEDNPTTVFLKGVKLGKQLAGMPSGAKRWKRLAKLWAQTIVYITPSHHTAKHHMEYLESGGEFLTKIWVLLYHAGILNLDREKDKGSKRAQPETV